MKKPISILIISIVLFFFISGFYLYFFFGFGQDLLSSSPIQQGGTSTYSTPDGKQVSLPIFSQDVKISGLMVLTTFSLFLTILLFVIPLFFYYVGQKIKISKPPRKSYFYVVLILMLIFL